MTNAAKTKAWARYASKQFVKKNVTDLILSKQFFEIFFHKFRSKLDACFIFVTFHALCSLQLCKRGLAVAVEKELWTNDFEVRQNFNPVFLRKRSCLVLEISLDSKCSKRREISIHRKYTSPADSSALTVSTLFTGSISLP